MSKVFFTADPHFGHQGILKHEPRYRPFSTVEGMNEVLVDNWNSVVTNKDTVYVLGDVCYGHWRDKDNLFEGLDHVKRLNGAKHLIKGNHDNFEDAEYLKRGFNTVKAYSRYKGCILSHIPVHESQIDGGRFKANIHGHLHSRKVDMGTNSNRYICVSVELHGLKPVSFEDLKKKHKILT